MTTFNVVHPARAFPGRVIGYRGKRLIDFVLSGIGLMLLSPIFVAVAIAIRLTSPGPILFRQKRLGLNEVPFTIFKFRSMRTDAESTGPKFTVDGDSRITPIGRLIRRTSLDELPQLINVFRGDMSLLGPRPYVGFELADWTAEQRAVRAAVRPGISGMAQANGRSSLSVEDSRNFDMQYVSRCSPALDAQLIWQTVKSILGRRGAN